MTDRIGQQLGNYQLLRLLGEGGFAEVYLGKHIHLSTQAAIKVLHTQLSSDDIDQFRTEARTITRLIHPHIVRVLEFGIEGKTPYLVMDYAPNGTLRQRHPKGVALPLSFIVGYVKQIADALQYAHDEEVIHRDVKPENMLLGRRNEILLSDFGIALVAQSSRSQSDQEIAGTMAYMAPEQIQGKPRPASDQYALGIVVYEWLTGDRPFHGLLTELVGQHLAVAPPSLLEKISTISPEVDRVVLTALAKDPRQRFDSVRTFANALEQASRSLSPSLSTAAVPWEEPSPLPSKPLQRGTEDGRILSIAPSVEPMKPQRISRRSIVLGTGIAIAAISIGGIAWAVATSSRTATTPPPTMRTSSPVVSPPSPVVSPSPAVLPSPTVPVEGVANLSYSTDLGHWGINYNSPSRLDLSTTPPASSWIQPASRGIKRFFGIINFGDQTRMNVILDQTTQQNSRRFFDGLAVFTFDNDTDFSNKATVNVPGMTGASQPVEFTITYANGSQQKYAIEVYTYVIGKIYVLGYYRNAVRQGNVILNGVSYPIAITDESSTGFYSLGTIDVTLDLNGDGNYEDNEHFNAKRGFTLNGQNYIIESIIPDGTQLVINKR